MRIGIITLDMRDNYGGLLQAYALQTTLQKMGHDVTILDRSRILNWTFFKKSRVYTKRFLRKLFIDRKTVIRIDKKLNEESMILRTNTYPFIQKYLNRIEVRKDFADVKEGCFDAFVVGSDQVWRPRYFSKPNIHHAFLSFARKWNVKRISYAASFGTDEWLYNSRQTKRCGNLLKKFNAVSVREDSAIKLCKKHFGVNSQQVLDPTMLLCTADYIELFKAAGTPPSAGTLMCYILDGSPDKEQIITHIAGKFNLKAFSANSKFDHPELPLSERIQPPVENWLRAFNDAAYVVTDSFHACVFSILFQKPFIAYGNKSRGVTRFTSLLKTFGLENRLATNREEAERAMNEPIDWEKTNAILREWKEKSFKYLKENLESQ